jgi:hypothetical protein
MAKLGRPTKYTDELAKLICQRVATCTEGLAYLYDKYDDMPHSDTIRVWRWEKPSFSAMYAQAKMFQAELMAEEIMQMSKEKLIYRDSEGNDRVDSGYTACQRLQVDSAKWIASKLAPKIYGDRKQSEELNPQDTLSKIKSLVDDLNKTNSSEI